MGYLDNTGLSYFWGKIKAALNLKQDALVSGTNIKTINNTSLLGSGNISISGGDSAPLVTYLTLNGSTYTADRTYTEIQTAAQNDQLVIAVDTSTANQNEYYYLAQTEPYWGFPYEFRNIEGSSYRRFTLDVIDDEEYWLRYTIALASLSSPAFTGNPTAPTQTAGNNSTRLATTAFVQGELADYSSITANNAIASNADLNSLTAPGDYYANTPTARTLSNTPYDNPSTDALAFVLKVVRTLGAASSAFLRQELVEYTIPSVGANIWVRYSTNSGSAWSDWAKIPTEHQTITGVNSGGYANASGGKYVIFAKVKKSTGTPWGALSANQYIVGNANNATTGNKGIYLLNITNRNNVFSMIVRKIMPDYGTVTFGYYSTTENGVDYWNIGVASTSGYSSIPSVFCINEGSPSSTHRVELLSAPTILDSAPTGWTAVSMDVVATTADINTAIGSAILASY